MRKLFNPDAVRLAFSRGGPRAWLLLTGSVLLLANVVALILYVVPPGGSIAELRMQRDQLKAEIAATAARDTRLRTVSGKVQAGSTEAQACESQYFLPERAAYSAVITELQRMSKAAGVEELEAVFSKEPIEGSDDLSVLNVSVRFQGVYPNLMKFLHEADQSPMLLMLDTLQATPQQRTGNIDAQVRFQAIVHDQQGAGPGVLE